MKRMKDITLFWICLIVGLILVVVGTVLCIKKFDYSNKLETVGTIYKMTKHIDGEGRTYYQTHVSYAVDGVNYQEPVDGCSSPCYVGKSIVIYYDKDDATKIGTKRNDLLMLIIPGIGIFLTIVSTIALVKTYKKINRLKNKD